MRGGAVHRVYAEEESVGFREDERPVEFLGEGRLEGSPEEPWQESPGDEHPQELRGRPLMQPAWRAPQRGRAMAIALLAAGVAFVAMLAIHALARPGAIVAGRGTDGAGWARSQAPPVAASLGTQVRRRSGKTAFHSAHKRRVKRRAVRVQPRQAKSLRRTTSVPRARERAVAYSSPARATSVVAAGAAESEFSFER